MDVLLIIIFVLFGLGIIGYFFLMFFYPEWVGITGSETKRELELESLEIEKKRALETAALEQNKDLKK